MSAPVQLKPAGMNGEATNTNPNVGPPTIPNLRLSPGVHVPSTATCPLTVTVACGAASIDLVKMESTIDEMAKKPPSAGWPLHVVNMSGVHPGAARASNVSETTRVEQPADANVHVSSSRVSTIGAAARTFRAENGVFRGRE